MNKYFRRVREQNTTQAKEKNIRTTQYDKWGTWSDRIGVGVNIVLAAITLLLFSQAIRQNNISEQNIALADSSAKAARLSAIAAQRTVDYADSSFKLAKESIASSDSDFIETIRLTKKSVDASNKAASLADSAFNLNKVGLNLTAKIFEIDNRAIIYFDQINLNTVEINKPITVQIGFKNYGKSPAYFRSLRTAISFDTSVNFKNFSYTKDQKKYINLLCIQQNGFVSPVFSSNIVVDSVLNYFIKTERINVFFHGELFYEDISTNKYFVYSFCIRIKPNKVFELMNYHNNIFELNNQRDLKLLN